MDDCHLGYITKLKKIIHAKQAQNDHPRFLLHKNKSPLNQWVIYHVWKTKVSTYHKKMKYDLTSNDNWTWNLQNKITV